MIDHRPDRLPAQPPTVAAPPAFTDRRVTYRRAEDRVAHQEKVLLARALDVLASDSSAEERLAGLLRLLARTVGARRVAVVADGIERRAAVAIDRDEDPALAEALAAWLDVHAPRTRARRAAAGRAPISLILAAVPETDAAVHADTLDRDPTTATRRGLAPVGLPARTLEGARAEGDGGRHYAMLPIPSAGDVALGFEFGRAADAEHLAERLPPTLARHAAVVLALVTAQLSTERELATLRAREAERSTFVSTVAHELRTPLTGLRGYLELILGDQIDDPAVTRDFLDRSRSIVASMGELVGDLLEISKLESGTLGLQIEPFSLAEACSQVAGTLLPIGIEHGVRLTTSLPPRLRVARGDRRRVEQILTNLVANALKFTPAGGSVEIDARFDGPIALIAIRDDGAGIPEDDRERIFERFHRMAGHERITGTGLGLPIARDLARQMDGDLGVASAVGVGSAFILALPGPTAVADDLVATALERALEAGREALGNAEERRGFVAAIGRAAWTEDVDPGPWPGQRSESRRLRVLPGVRGETRTPA